MINFWDKYYNVYDRFISNSPTYHALVEYIVDLLEINKKTKILDAGSGSGILASQLIDLNQDVYCLDNSEEAIKLLISRCPKVKAFKHDLKNKLLFDNNTFDRIVSTNVLYTFDQKIINNILIEFYRVLKPGGRLIITDPKKDFSNFKIFFSDCKYYYRKYSYYYGSKIILCNLMNYLILYYYNIIIDSKEKINVYTYFTEQSYRNLVDKYYKIKLSNTAYADQNNIIVMEK